MLSVLCHFASFSVVTSPSPLSRAVLVTSIDVDVGSPAVGEINRGRNDRNVHPYMSERTVGKLEEICLPMLVSLFEEFRIPVTFALRGQLFDVDASIPHRLLDSTVGFDVGAHGYSHRQFTLLTREEAGEELKLIQAGMGRLGLKPTSFVFPRNAVKHLGALRKFGYRAFRERGGLLHDATRISKIEGLYNIHPSLFVNRGADWRLLAQILNIVTARRLPFHIWFHPTDLGRSKIEMEETIRRLYRPFFQFAKASEQKSLLRFETMSSLVQLIDRTRLS